ncbi:FAD/FMN-containing isoamyl alcohol oxidase MreA [Hypoxylon sp. NC0597]|nr:FAD/FMN-containing isoamyl alcohol oxidase MreA [Hypoxylon sp. NC0597]
MSPSSLKTLLRLFLACAVVRASVGNTTTPAGCRSIPGDSSWPSQAKWDALNKTVGGNLVSTIPIAAPCHETLFGEPNPLFNQENCDALRNIWFFPTTHLPSSSSPMEYPFSNNSCNPFLGPETPCTMGGLVAYTVNATCTRDIQAAIQFAKNNNIRLVIRNTGHDYLGKSTGAHSLGVWTHNLNTLDLIQDYQGGNYTGPAIKVGAGVKAIDAYEFADSHGLILVAGNCPTVGVAGGYLQGGGHGPLSSKFGLAADQVLEWEVITADGEVLTATATNNSDLFWALRGGGGSTFGVVLSATVKVHPDTYFSTAYMTVPNNGSNADALYSVVGTFIETLPALTDAGAIAIFEVAADGFFLVPAIAPDMQSSELDAHFQPVINKLNNLGLEYTYSSSTNSTFLRTFNSITTISNVSDQNLGGRFIPRSLVENNQTNALLDAIRYISSQPDTLFVGNAINVKKFVSSPDDIAANPAFREALFSATLGNYINYTHWDVTVARQRAITDDLLPQLEALTPNGGAYLNEGDVNQPDFQKTFYGDHYDRLLQIKTKYDPKGIFYAQTAVGSERWKQDLDGRLCMT